MNRCLAVEDDHDVPVAISIHQRKHRNLLAPQYRLKFLEIVRTSHLQLFNELPCIRRRLQSHRANRKQFSILPNDWPGKRLPRHEWHVLQATIILTQYDRLRFGRELPLRAIELISVAVRREFAARICSSVTRRVTDLRCHVRVREDDFVRMISFRTVTSSTNFSRTSKPRPGRLGTAIMPWLETSTSGSIRSSCQ